jgi:hypothetical protein
MITKYALAEGVSVVLDLQTNFLSKILRRGGIDMYKYQNIDVRKNPIPTNVNFQPT